MSDRKEVNTRSIEQVVIESELRHALNIRLASINLGYLSALTYLSAFNSEL
jgi:hypothetical protein